MMKIKIMSDTHGFHHEESMASVDMLIHCGDASNHIDPVFNEHEFLSFWRWFEMYPAETKIYVPGNHDSWLASPMSKNFKKNLTENICILIDKTVYLQGLKIFGSPYTPRYGAWHFMVDREKIYKRWKLIESGTDIVITHGPPKGILDTTTERDGRLKHAGDGGLYNKIDEVHPRLHCFGHIHDDNNNYNHGIFKKDGITYINASQVIDNKFDRGLSHRAIIVDF